MCTAGNFAIFALSEQSFSKLAQSFKGGKATLIWATKYRRWLKMKMWQKQNRKNSSFCLQFFISFNMSSHCCWRWRTEIGVLHHCGMKSFLVFVTVDSDLPVLSHLKYVWVCTYIFILEVMFEQCVDFGSYFGWNIKTVYDSDSAGKCWEVLARIAWIWEQPWDCTLWVNYSMCNSWRLDTSDLQHVAGVLDSLENI